MAELLGVISLAGQIDELTDAYLKADWASKFAHGWTLPGCPGGGRGLRKSRHECNAAVGAAVAAETALTQALLRITGTTKEEALADERPIAVATVNWLVTADPSVEYGESYGLDGDWVHWLLTIAPRVRDVVFVDKLTAPVRQVEELAGAYEEADLAVQEADADWRSRSRSEVLRERGDAANRLRGARAALVAALLRTTGSTEAEHRDAPCPFAVATPHRMVTAVPSVVIDRGQPSDTVAWELFVGPRARDIVFVGDD
jgi:hypothetical protein